MNEINDGQHAGLLDQLDEPGVHAAAHCASGVEVTVVGEVRVAEPTVGGPHAGRVVARRGIEPGRLRKARLQRCGQDKRLEVAAQRPHGVVCVDDLRLVITAAIAPVGGHGHHLRRTGLHHGPGRGDVAVLTHPRPHGVGGGTLDLGIESGVHDHPAPVELLLPLLGGGAEGGIGQHEVAHIGAVVREVGVLAASLGLGDVQPQRTRGHLFVLLLVDVALGKHPLQHLVAPLSGCLTVAGRLQRRWRLHQAGQSRCLVQVQFARRHAVVAVGRCIQAVGLVAEVDGVQVTGQDLVLGELLVRHDGQLRLAQLAGPRLLGGRLDVSLVDGCVRQDVLHPLLGDRRSPLQRVAAGVAQHRPGQRLDIHPGMLEEVGVLHGDDRVDHHLGDLVPLDGDPVGGRKFGERVTVTVHELRAPRDAGDVRDLHRHGLPDLDSDAGAGGADEGNTDQGPDDEDRRDDQSQGMFRLGFGVLTEQRRQRQAPCDRTIAAAMSRGPLVTHFRPHLPLRPVPGKTVRRRTAHPSGPWSKPSPSSPCARHSRLIP